MVISRVMGGAFKPMLIGDQLYYQSYDATGYNHALLTRAALGAKQGLERFNIQQQSGQFNDPNLYQELVGHFEEEAYSPWSILVLTTWMPVLSILCLDTIVGLYAVMMNACSKVLEYKPMVLNIAFP